MEEDLRKIELIDRFMANEKKSRMWTTGTIALFCLLGLFVVYLAILLNNKNKLFKDINKQLVKTQDSLAKAVAKLDEYNSSLKQDSITLSKRVGNYDSVKNVLDTVLVLLNETQTGAIQNGTPEANHQIDQITMKAYDNNKVVLSDNIKKAVLNKEAATSARIVYTVFIQCMQGYEKMMPALSSALKERKYSVPKWEVINTVSFNPVVKYFYDEDKEEATRIAALVNKSDDFFTGNPVVIQKVELKSPLHQVEVWVGKYQPKQLKQIVQQSSRGYLKKQ